MNGVDLLLGDAALARHGARTALLCDGEALTYAELATAVRRGCGALRSAGVVPGDRVLFLMQDTPEFAAAWLAVVRAGALAVALNPRLPESESRQAVTDGARLVFMDASFAPQFPGLAAELGASGRLCVAGASAFGTSSWRARMAQASEGPAAQVEPDSGALVLYTSGTTARPKAIVHGHKIFQHLGKAFEVMQLEAGERVFATSKFFFAYGLEHGLLGPLAKGMTCVLHPGWLDADAMLRVVERHRPSAVFSVPTLYRHLLAQPQSRMSALATVRHFVAAGERLSPQIVAQWRGHSGKDLLNLYGMSETLCACMMTPPGTSDGVRTGKPLPGVDVRLLPAGGEETASGTGVLWIRHPAQASGYANLPDATREQFQDGWFCSRDLFRRDAQRFYVHQGRTDELVKVAGQWVHPSELEEAAAQHASSVLEAACVPVADEDGLMRLALFVTARGDAASAERDAAAVCEQRLPPHKRPKWVRAVRELPRTATGKLQRYRLREVIERELAGKDR